MQRTASASLGHRAMLCQVQHMPSMRLTMSGTHPIGFLVLLFTLLPSIATIQKLNSIKDLKTIAFGQSVPAHSLVLLHWFANNIELDNNNAIELTFEPNQGDYGTHHYGNYEGMLDPLPPGNRAYQYYTLGNLNHMNTNQGNLERLPQYVAGQLNNLMVHEELNRDRIVFRLRNQNTIDRVYITQHYGVNQGRGTVYDPEHTYQITTNLLRELRIFSLDQSGVSELSEIRDHFRSGVDNQQLNSIRNKWGDLACLGLLVFIVMSEKNLPRKTPRAPAPQQNRPAKQNLRPKRPVGGNVHHGEGMFTVVNIPEYNPYQEQNQIKLEVTAGKNGKATVCWRGVPRHILQGGVKLVLFKNDGDTRQILNWSTATTSGVFETSVPLNKGLQVRLHEARRFCIFFTRVGEEISRGPEYHNAKAETLVSIAGFNAKLNMFVKDGTACARLYIPDYTTDWKDIFKKCWVGFYTSEIKQTNQYETWQWQWATKFEEKDNVLDNVYEYHSSVPVALGVHVRFIDGTGAERARTLAWRQDNKTRELRRQQRGHHTKRLTMSGTHPICFLVLLFTLLPSIATIQKLNSIKDLKTIAFGQSVPAHSLVLLHWFANDIEFDTNNEIQLSFEPDQEHYGTHHYGNYERILDPLPRGHGTYQYYTLGNLNHMNTNQGDTLTLPSYYTNRLNNLMESEEPNRSRILFRLRNRNTVDQVYITQHYGVNRGQGTVYDPQHTYQITTNLLRELRVFSLDDNNRRLSEIANDCGGGINDARLLSLRGRWGNLAHLGLLVLVVMGGNKLSSATIQKLNSIKDLKTIAFGQSVPAHSLVLLHWFANNIEFDNNNEIQLSFEPDQEHYGTHHYGNYQRILDSLPTGHDTYQYYTLGNLNDMNTNQGDTLTLPSYYTNRLNNLMESEEPNRSRILFRLRNRNTVDQVYITQHYANREQGTGYDRQHTYQITTNLLRELRVFSFDDNNGRLSDIANYFGGGISDAQLLSLRSVWGNLARLGLLVLVVMGRNNLSSATIQKLNSIEDLKTIKFGQSVPAHSLVLLHWFANDIEFDNNEIQLSFEPDQGHYGTHRYGNYERVLDPLPPGHGICQYYTLGNLNYRKTKQGNALTLPPYFTNRLNNLMVYEEPNRSRILFRLRNGNTVDQVYITQHYGVNRGQGTVYDPQHTYQITTNLLSELRVFSLANNNNRRLSEIANDYGGGISDAQLLSLRSMWGDLARLGLLVLVVMGGNNLSSGRAGANHIAVNIESNNPTRNDVSGSSSSTSGDNKTREIRRQQRGHHTKRTQDNKTREIRRQQRGNHTKRLTMSGTHPIGFLVLLFTLLPSIATIQKLNSIKDLKTIAFGQSVPAHSLVLLHWFANDIEFDNNEIQLSFEPDQGHYGTHHYGNYERVLDPLPSGQSTYQYYTLGNLNHLNTNQGDTLTLPPYFTNRLNNLMESEEPNRSRILFRLRNGNTVDQVYITQHYGVNWRQGTEYDRQHTYQITTNLLRELRVFSLANNNNRRLSDIANDYGGGISDAQLRSLRSMWGDLARLGLLVLVVMGGKKLISGRAGANHIAIDMDIDGYNPTRNDTPPPHNDISGSSCSPSELNSIKDLKTIAFGQSVPAHSLVLLHWFANNIEFDNNNEIQLSFEPDQGHYGTHHYGNYQGILDPLPPGHSTYQYYTPQYYTLGNLNHMNTNQGNTLTLPSYFTNRLNNLMVSEEPNRSRILFRLRNRNTVDQVYITQHYANWRQGSEYDRQHTYQITTNLLRELRVFSLANNNNRRLSDIANDYGGGISDAQLLSLSVWGDLARLGLLVLVVMGGKNLSSGGRITRPESSDDSREDTTPRG
ncbi:hypothetical protein NHX12_031171 [Muraenolepis orangiensis]|uniref:Uncharacterized protein n=1 Tax=Muraenolepis orangiensis TaxID=630683 RepID=A0A9Q0E7C7_9TELE|nr:hypothetical protein NHX12_031171 [Muraenolepis orangiensis]